MTHSREEKRAAGGRLLPACVALLSLVVASPGAWCQATGANPGDSPLRKFEKGAQPQPAPAAPPPHPSSPSRGDPPADHDSDSLDDFFAQLVIDAIEFTVRSGAIMISQQSQRTLQRLDPVAESTEPRHDGDSLIPFVRYDYSRQSVASGIDGGFHRLETGYGPAAVMLENYTLRDTAANARLTLERYLFLYRYSPSRNAEYDFGAGVTKMYGVTTSSYSTVSLVGRFMVGDHLSLELRPSWAGTISDYEASLAWTLHYASLKAGYRSMTSPGGTLQGPFVGFALHD